MARPTASQGFNFDALTPEAVEDGWSQAGTVVPIPESIVKAVQASLDAGTGEGKERVGSPLSFTVPSDKGVDGANVVTLKNFLRRAADAKNYGMDVRAEIVKSGKDAGKAVKVSFRTRGQKFAGRGRKPATASTEAPAAS
jgi:hypothetical protein